MNLKGPEGLEYLLEEYVRLEKSPYEIAENLGTYPNAVRTALLRHGVPLRTKKEAQEAALRSGRASHPTKGRERTPGEKERISASIAASWAASPESSRVERALKSQQAWERRTVDDLWEMSKKAIKGTHEASRNGSRLENHLHAAILAAGYKAGLRRKHLIVNESMHVDIVVESPPVAIEVDGPSHHFPIYGEERLERTREADRRKDGLLLQGGMAVVRVKALAKRSSDSLFRKAAEDVVAIIKQVESRFPPEGDRFFEMSVGERTWP